MPGVILDSVPSGTILGKLAVAGSGRKVLGRVKPGRNQGWWPGENQADHVQDGCRDCREADSPDPYRRADGNGVLFGRPNAQGDRLRPSPDGNDRGTENPLASAMGSVNTPPDHLRPASPPF